MSADQWNERYRHGEHAHDAPLAFIVEHLPPGNGRRALDLACGSGRHSVLLAEHGWQVTAVDWSEAALELVHTRDARIAAVCADLEAGAFPIQPNSWDLICVSLYMQRPLFAAIRNGLRAEGYLAAAFPMIDDRPGVKPMNPEYLMRPGELRSLFPGFRVLHDNETQPEPPKRRIAELFAQAVV
jgi:SAM-dependent methyltransferase